MTVSFLDLLFGGLIRVGEMFAARYAPLKIRVNSIVPGRVRTPMGVDFNVERSGKKAVKKTLQSKENDTYNGGDRFFRAKSVYLFFDFEGAGLLSQVKTEKQKDAEKTPFRGRSG